MHQKVSPLAGQKIKIKPNVKGLGGKEILIKDWWDRVYGNSWMNSNGNRACMEYAIRTGFSTLIVPINDEVLYGKIGSMGFLVNVIELEIY